MYKYFAKTTYEGWSLGLENYNSYIGVPKRFIYKAATPQRFIIEHQGKEVEYDAMDEVCQREQIQQLDIPGPHILCYFLWERKN